ncbi:hypothetical protein MmiHf6_07060 [Methanimicrococcus hongohii]|uniref:Uncharacterized protein n=1 Tax=Methanimicrococcus hongohii TaxID=3028295 RepID=A0AA96UZB1_9EURY|nr:hypothetical protein [Methanimicrococcus sp. Hf6]WNY23399.1 hypothetical protein MmiHf6_07060 [Methanimicrococcus sp. Hf6]
MSKKQNTSDKASKIPKTSKTPDNKTSGKMNRITVGDVSNKQKGFSPRERPLSPKIDTSDLLIYSFEHYEKCGIKNVCLYKQSKDERKVFDSFIHDTLGYTAEEIKKIKGYRNTGENSHVPKDPEHIDRGFHPLHHFYLSSTYRLHGFCDENIFYIISMDPPHDVNE